MPCVAGTRVLPTVKLARKKWAYLDGIQNHLRDADGGSLNLQSHLTVRQAVHSLAYRLKVELCISSGEAACIP